MNKNKGNMAIWFVIVIVVVAVLVYLTINSKKTVPVGSQLGQAGQSMSNEEDIQKVDGVDIVVLVEGTGESVKSGDLVAMNYTGFLADGTVFDSNTDANFGHVEPFIFTLGAGQVIPGWDIGVSGMKVGEKRTLVISSDYAYGASGIGGVIPPNAALTFEVELIAVQK
jgi:peptidylprolyl isomerase